MHCKSTMHKSVDPSDVLGGGNVSSINHCGFTAIVIPDTPGTPGTLGTRYTRYTESKKLIRSIQNLNFIAYSEAPLQEPDVPPV